MRESIFHVVVYFGAINYLSQDVVNIGLFRCAGFCVLLHYGTYKFGMMKTPVKLSRFSGCGGCMLGDRRQSIKSSGICVLVVHGLVKVYSGYSD